MAKHCIKDILQHFPSVVYGGGNDTKVPMSERGVALLESVNWSTKFMINHHQDGTVDYKQQIEISLFKYYIALVVVGVFIKKNHNTDAVQS